MKNFQSDLDLVGMGEVTAQRDISLACFTINIDGELLSGFGNSKRSHPDKPNREVGSYLAVARALYSIANQLERRANGLVLNSENERAHRKQLVEAKLKGPEKKRVAKPANKISSKKKTRAVAKAK